MDNCCNTDSSMAAGVGKQLHDGRIHSCFAHHRNRCGVDKGNSGKQTVVGDVRPETGVKNPHGKCS